MTKDCIITCLLVIDGIVDFFHWTIFSGASSTMTHSATSGSSTRGGKEKESRKSTNVNPNKERRLPGEAAAVGSGNNFAHHAQQWHQHQPQRSANSRQRSNNPLGGGLPPIPPPIPPFPFLPPAMPGKKSLLTFGIKLYFQFLRNIWRKRWTKLNLDNYMKIFWLNSAFR